MSVDCHIHMVLDGKNARESIQNHKLSPQESCIRNILQEYQNQGFTYLRDGGDRWGVGKLARSLAEEYGIRYRCPLAPLYKVGHYGGFIGRGFSTLEEFTQLVKETRQAGGDFIKIMISGLMEFDRFGVLSEAGLDAKFISAMIATAQDAGFSVMAHCNGSAAAIAAAEAGVDSIEHGAYLNTEALHAMAEAEVIWVPTLSAIGNLLGKGRFSDDSVRQILASSMENLRSFADLGGYIAQGSDAGAWAVPHAAKSEAQLLETALGSHWESIVSRGNALLQQRF